MVRSTNLTNSKLLDEVSELPAELLSCVHGLSVCARIQEAETAADGVHRQHTLDASASAENLTVEAVSESTQSAEIPEEFTVGYQMILLPSLPTSERAGSETKIEVSLDLDVDVDLINCLNSLTKRVEHR